MVDIKEKLVALQDESDICPEGITSCIGCKYHKEYAFGNPCDVRAAIADKMIAHGVTVQEWISVKDRLPPYNHDVLVYRPHMATKIMVDSYNGYYGEDDNEWYEGWAKYGKDIHNNPIITHWAYLPQPPKGEQ